MASDNFDCVYRVAYDMAHFILSKEAQQAEKAENFRDYFLTLYTECLDATRGSRPEIDVKIT